MPLKRPSTSTPSLRHSRDSTPSRKFSGRRHQNCGPWNGSVPCSFFLPARKTGPSTLYRDNLEREVDIRTRELETANEELRKEIEERRRMGAEVRYRAYHDALTGLANRDLFSARLQEPSAGTSPWP